MACMWSEVLPWLQPTSVLLVLAASVYLWVSGRLPADVTALLAMVALLVTGVLTPEETFAGFSHPATLSVAAMLVLSAGLERTGAIAFLARRVLGPLGGSEGLLTFVLMLVTGTMSAFVNNTACVAVFLPVVREVSRRTKARASKLYMPMAHAATLGGLCTLMGTSTNVVAHEFARANGLPGFGMFEVGLVGLPMALAGMAYVFLVGRWFLPSGGESTPKTPPRSGEYQAEVVVQPGSTWVGKRMRAQDFARDYEVELLGLSRDGSELRLLGEEERFSAGDRLRVRGPLERVLALEHAPGLELRRPNPKGAPASELAPATASVQGPDSQASGPQAAAPAHEIRELMVLPRSWLIGSTLASLGFARRFGSVVLAVHRPNELLHGTPASHVIHAGDVLVVEGPAEVLDTLSAERSLYYIGRPNVPADRVHKVWIALLVMVAVVAVVALGWAEIVVAATTGAAVLMLTGCLQPREAYKAIDLELVFLLAGSLALGRALDETGVTSAFGQALATAGGGFGPHAVMAGFLISSVLISEFMSNSGTVLLLGPVALSTSAQLGLNPMALLAAIMFGSSAAFAMPIGYQTSLMILRPGGYRVKDFVRMGLALDLFIVVIGLWLIPRYWPLTVGS